MVDYMKPNCDLSVQEKIEMFSFRSEMNDLPFDFGRKENCEQGCQTPMNNEHCLNCPKLNEIPNLLEYSNIQNGTLRQKIEVFQRLKLNLQKRAQLLMNAEY